MNPTILIIDDDAKLNQLLEDFLKDFGYAVITATHPARGLKKTETGFARSGDSGHHAAGDGRL